MNIGTLLIRTRSILLFCALLFFLSIEAQHSYPQSIPQTTFWERVQYGGGIGLSFGSGYTDISLSPSAIFNINSIFAVGFGLQGSYASSKGFYNSTIYGANVIGLINPIPQVQFSVSLNESRVNNIYNTIGGGRVSNNFWNTGLFIGAGYRTGNITVGMTYNVLFDPDKDIYGNAYLPFIRAYF